MNMNSSNQKPYLKLEILCLSGREFELDENDIQEVFQRYGTINKVLVQQQGRAFIIYNNMNSAYIAQKTLDGYLLRDVQVKLLVQWCTLTECNMINYILTTEPTYNHKSNLNRLDHSQKENIHEQYSTHLLHELNNKYQNKFTCKYLVQIENDKDFQVAKKIIGPKGCNMKRIVELCLHEFRMSTHDTNSLSDIIKLRLRGRGSGFKEGPEQKESDEPLHLCVSSKVQEVYMNCCRLVEELFSNIYHEYKTQCFRLGKKFDPNLKSKKIECNFQQKETTSSLAYHNNSPTFGCLQDTTEQQQEEYNNYFFNDNNNTTKRIPLTQKNICLNENTHSQNEPTYNTGTNLWKIQ